jgi:hypothetical protein
MILNNLEGRGIFSFLLINIIFFINPFVFSLGMFPIHDFVVMLVLFCVVLTFELFIITILNFYKIAFLFFYLLNYLNFILPLLPYSFKINLFLFFIFLFIGYLFFCKDLKKIVYTYLSIFLSIMIFSQISFSKNNLNSYVSKINKKAHKNIYLVGIDGMVSEVFFHKFYGSNYEVVDKLKNDNFEVFDFISPGASTLQTYSSMVSYNNKSEIKSRDWRRIISDKKSNFYKDLDAMGYKKQFLYMDNYFGINSSGPFDNFSPNIDDYFSFYNYVNPNWAYPLILFVRMFNPEVKDQFNNIIQKLIIPSNNSQKWLSISHVWFPGHTSLNFNGNDNFSRSNYISDYRNSQRILINRLENLKNKILQIDSDAVIVFWGDHGSYLLRNVKENSKISNLGTISAHDLHEDSTGVLVAIYPRDIGKKIKLEVKDNTLLFKKIIELSN